MLMYDVTTDSANHAKNDWHEMAVRKNMLFILKKRSQEMADYQINTQRHFF